MASRNQVLKAMDQRLIPHSVYDEKHPYHYGHYAENLYCPMGEQALQAYSRGSGSELLGKDGPAKMSSIASSSAMTFNLLGNGPAVIDAGGKLPAGAYQVEFEKQLLTQNTGRFPANLDAFLSNESAKTAIFCEMKLLEWLQTANQDALAESYSAKNRFFAPEDGSYDAFTQVIEKMNSKPFRRYDGYQMFKHLLGIYNHTAHTTRDGLQKFPYPSMAGQYSQICLVNVVNEFPFSDSEYCEALKEEKDEADTFRDLIEHSDIPDLFKRNCGAKLKILYMSADAFAAKLKMSHEKREYLTNRYF